jgi:hypothetical protein
VEGVLLAVIVVLGVILLVVTAYMEWIGILNVLTRRSAAHYSGCGHLKAVRPSECDRCWRCRHQTVLHPSHLIPHH